MTTDRVPAAASHAVTPLPSYAGDLRTGVFMAEFKSGARVPVNVSRARAYPGLASTAPSTVPFYAAVEDMNLRGPVLDAGAGSGEGARTLRDAGREVVAVELDRAAAHFLREYAPGVQVVEADLCLDAPVSGMAAAVVADTLGHVADPEAFLRNLRRCLTEDGTLLIAEPLAQLAQRLVAPARRAWTKQELGAILTRSGFVVDGWLSSSGTFVACVARRVEDSTFDALQEAGNLAQIGQFAAARHLLEGSRTE